MSDLLVRLQRQGYRREMQFEPFGTTDIPCDHDDDGAESYLVNPDGPEAMKRISDLLAALEQAATWFEDYANDHYAKAKTAPDCREQHGREVKGKTNADRAKVLRAAIARTSPGPRSLSGAEGDL